MRVSVIIKKPWCNVYHYCTVSFNKIGTLRWFKPWSQRVGDLQWLESLTMISAGNKALTPFVGQPYGQNNSSHHHQYIF